MALDEQDLRLAGTPARRGGGLPRVGQRPEDAADGKVYWSPNQAWRCVTDKNGKRHVLAAIDSSGRLPDTALGKVVASGLDVASR